MFGKFLLLLDSGLPLLYLNVTLLVLFFFCSGDFPIVIVCSNFWHSCCIEKSSDCMFCFLIDKKRQDYKARRVATVSPILYFNNWVKHPCSSRNV